MKAFPTTRNNEQTGIWQTEDGMDLRDYFAAKALDSLIQIASYDDFQTLGKRLEKVTSTAYKVADAMMRAREVK